MQLNILKRVKTYQTYLMEELTYEPVFPESKFQLNKVSHFFLILSRFGFLSKKRIKWAEPVYFLFASFTLNLHGDSTIFYNLKYIAYRWKPKYQIYKWSKTHLWKLLIIFYGVFPQLLTWSLFKINIIIIKFSFKKWITSFIF